MVTPVTEQSAFRPNFSNNGKKSSNFVSDSAKWLWKHKADLGFWVSTSALVLALPATKGRDLAVAGKISTLKASPLAEKFARKGMLGSSAVSLAKTGAEVLKKAHKLIAVSKTGKAIYQGRVKLGSTSVGKLMLASQKPVTAASTLIAGAYFADNTYKASKGKGSIKDLLLSALTLTPTGVSVVKMPLVRNLTGSSKKVAEVQEVLGNASMHANNINNAVQSVKETKNGPITQATFARGLANWFLKRNAQLPT